jgi:hypothetical protein
MIIMDNSGYCIFLEDNTRSADPEESYRNVRIQRDHTGLFII